MINPPKNLIVEIPGRETGCPMQCKHCLHKSNIDAKYPPLSEQQIIDIIRQGKKYRIEFLNLYPHDDEISFPPYSAHEYLKFGHKSGYKVKTVSNGANPEGIERMLPFLFRLAISVDSLDPDIYSEFREKSRHQAVLETLNLLKRNQQKNPINLTALILVDQNTLNRLEKTIDAIIRLNLFNKIRIQELLPLGDAENLADLLLNAQRFTEKLKELTRRYAPEIDFGTPLWRIKPNGRSCRLGFKDMVIGPAGQLAGCSLLFCANHLTGYIQEYESLAQAWEIGFQPFREKENRPLPEICLNCEFYKRNLCWGGCLARALILGYETEINRSCGIRNRADSLQLYRQYLENKADNSNFYNTVVQKKPGK